MPISRPALLPIPSRGAIPSRRSIPIVFGPALALVLTLLASLGARAGTPTIPISKVGSAELLSVSTDGLRPMPLLGMEVGIEVTEILVRGRIDQVFHNPDPVSVEAIYVFPLPENAAVDAMEMRIGDRIIRSVVREREEARRVYEEARDTGRKAALVEEERPNLFTTTVANIGPGETITIHLEYLEEIEPEGDRYEFAFPLTLTPRYTPASAERSAVPALPVANNDQSDRPGSGPSPAIPGHGGSRVDPPFHDPGYPLAPRAILNVSLLAPTPLPELRSVSHDIETSRDGDVVRITTTERSVAADRDFLLEWRAPRGAEPGPEAYAEDVGDDRYLLVTIQPPLPDASTRAEGSVRTETLFVLDISGSMDGPSIRQARSALRRAVEHLRPSDSFNVLWFNDSHGSFAHEFVNAEAGELERARAWIGRLEANGGTEIHGAFLRALDLCSGKRTEAQRRIVFLTDGAVSNEEELLSAVVARRGDLRIHVIGIGHAPNRYLMAKLAEEGQGLHESIAGDEEVGPRLDRFLARIERPVLSDLVLSGLPEDAEISPSPIPDLYRDAALQLSVRIPGVADQEIETRDWALRGTLGGRPWHHSVRQVSAKDGAGIGTRWARGRIDDALGRLRRGAPAAEVRAEVLELGLGFHLVTPYTSLVAVEERATALGPSVAAPVANALPAGSRLGGTLPRGGTNEPLWTLLGWICTGLGASLVFWIAAVRESR